VGRRHTWKSCRNSRSQRARRIFQLVFRKRCKGTSYKFAICVSIKFCSQTTEMRSQFYKAMFGGVAMVTLVIFAIFSIYWGALWQAPSNTHKLRGWIVDFDGDRIGQTVIQTFTSTNSPFLMTWEVHPASAFPSGTTDLANAVVEEKCWAAIASMSTHRTFLYFRL
jgi:hypothetical protein